MGEGSVRISVRRSALRRYQAPRNNVLGLFCWHGAKEAPSQGKGEALLNQLALVRVDDRLIHGQVVVKWLRHLGCDQIWIVDDALADDRFMQNVFRLAAPAGVQVQVVAAYEGAHGIADALRRGKRVMVLVKTPQVAQKLLEQGLPFRELNVGGLAAGPATTRLYKSVSATDEQVASLLRIQQQGVRVFFQMVPEEPPAELRAVMSGKDTRYCVSEEGCKHDD